MSVMQPGSGGPYSKQKNLYFRIDVLKNEILGGRYFGPIQRKRADTELANLKTELKKLNAEIRKGENHANNAA